MHIRAGYRFLLACLLVCSATAKDGEPLRIGSKRFTESYILGEILVQNATPFARVDYRPGLGNTAIVFQALRNGNIDLYPEYTGTIAQEIVKEGQKLSPDQLRAELAHMGLGMAIPLGFNNTYALAMRRSESDRLNIHRLSDLTSHPAIRLGLSHEFIGRQDGWPGLIRQYGLPQHPIALDHGLAYDALLQGQVDAIDIYSTDAKIGALDLRVLVDDAHFFPRYDAVILYRLDVPQRFPAAWRALQSLEGRIRSADMIAMNAAAELKGHSFSAIAHTFLTRGTVDTSQQSGLLDKLTDESMWRLTRQHVLLVALSVILATCIGIPLGVLAFSLPKMRHLVLAIVGVLQTVPSLALLAMLIPLMGTIGTLPALVALFLYALLPIVRNTFTALEQMPPGLRMAAMALGLERRDRLLHIELPLSVPFILAGIKTAAVMSVGTATIAAFIGAGGYGERIAIGLALNDNDMLLAGAIPAALLALLTQWLFELGERWYARRHGALSNRDL